MASSRTIVLDMGRHREFDATAAKKTAMDVFWRQGYAATSIGDLVEATGVSRSGLYAEFGSKWGLFLAALELYGTRLLQPLTRPLRERASGGVRSFLEQFIPGRKNPMLGCLLANTIVEFGDAETEISPFTDDYVNTLERGLREAIGREAGHEASASDLAAMLTCLAVGAFVLRRTKRGSRTVGRALRHTVRLLRL